jgi:hypothetical protein
VVGGELERANVWLERQDAVAGSASSLGWRVQAYLCPQRSGKRPAAFVSGAARIGMEIIFADGAGWRWFVSPGCHLVVAGRRTLRLHSQRRPHTVFVLGRYRCCRYQRRERPRKQDQQQESGSQASHS